MEIYPGELRFCEDCIHRIIVNGLQNDEIRCAKLGYRLGHASEANQCLSSNDFEETDIAKEARNFILIGNNDHILLE